MVTAAQFDPKMDADEKTIVAKAQVMLEREARITLSERHFHAFARALDSAFAPTPALKAALTQARHKVRRA